MVRENWRLWIFILVVVAIGTGFVFFRSELLGRNQPVVLNGIMAPPLPTLVPEQVASGEAVYAQFCAACHGANLEGQPNWKVPLADGSRPAPPHDSTGHTWHHTDQLLVDYVTLGGAETLRRLGVTGVQSGMPAFGSVLSEDEIDAVLDYIASHWSERARAYQAEVTRQAGGN